ncbi:hypothetical protein AC244_14100 [Ensifer adhaerens]|uniref:Uncharacterized protein n=1 Tax=Ensifer adhaerens TaxID=106592 RepID=A0A0L8BVF7_ENSAD|nr:hypothetical protein [Ensifer adhaerens]KOF18489.1 hypothetical protein AC244_14100 [Ensifer adhaerens]
MYRLECAVLVLGQYPAMLLNRFPGSTQFAMKRYFLCLEVEAGLQHWRDRCKSPHRNGAHALAVELAAEHGFKITNPEMQRYANR